MLKRYLPFAHAKNVYDIEIDFYKKMGVKYLLLDLDNTLDSYQTYHPSDFALELIQNLKDNGITPFIVSNNKGKRVHTYAGDVNVECIFSAGKPFPRKIKKFLKSKGIKNEEVMMVGDQMLTDVACGNGAKIRVILTDKLVEKDQPTTRINRFFERPMRKKANKKGLFIDWRDISL